MATYQYKAVPTPLKEKNYYLTQTLKIFDMEYFNIFISQIGLYFLHFEEMVYFSSKRTFKVYFPDEKNINKNKNRNRRTCISF